MLKVHGRSTFADIEALLLDIKKQGSEVCRFKPDLTLHSLGLETALIQFFATWQRYNKNPTLRTVISDVSTAPQYLNNIIDTPCALVAMLLAKTVTTDNGVDISAHANIIASKRYKTFSTIESRSQRLFLLVADAHPYSPEAAPFVHLTWDSRLTRRGHFITDFQFHLKRALGSISATALPPEHLSRLGSLVYELFSNTEEWATADENDAPLLTTVRGVSVDIVPVRSALLSEIPGELALKRYLAQLPAVPNANNEFMLEISVFDNGPGLAHRELRHLGLSDPNIEQEFNALTCCLQKRKTSSLDPRRGLGLFHVMRLLTELHGFLRLRTGHLSLIRDFNSDPLIVIETTDAPENSTAPYQPWEYLWDSESLPWTVARDPGQIQKRKRARAAGTLFTLWVPLGTAQPQLKLF